MAPRDSQRSKLYKAETIMKPFDEPYSSVQEIEKFVEYIWTLKRLQRAFPKAVALGRVPDVGDGRRRRNAGADTHSISMPRWSRTTHIILHELAHVIARREYTSWKIAGHGWQYCSVYLQLVRCVMGVEAHDTLKNSFKYHGVRFTEPTTRPITEERREELKARLVEVRAAKTIKKLLG